jgi:hypothetical protein
MTLSSLVSRRSPALLPVLALGLTLWGCGPEEALEDPHSGEVPLVCDAGSAVHRTELYFGRDREGGAPVSDAEWQDFVDASVTPRFPDGLTSYDARGQYLMENGELVHENSKVLLLLHDGSAERSADIDAVCAVYKARFQQESVLRVDSVSCIRFN